MPKLVTENMLHEWVASHEREAQGVIVELVARLVRAQCPRPKVFRFPFGDSIGQPGIDGWLETLEEYPPYINAGPSIWEIGTNAKPAEKLTSDYKKRLNDFSDVTRRNQTTFTFVTPRSASHTGWPLPKQEKWKKERESDGWKDIKIMDATILSDWLERLPAASSQ